MKCYYCKELDKEIETGDKPFCNEAEHELWAEKNYGQFKKENKSWTVEEMVEGLKRMAQDEREKGNRF